MKKSKTILSAILLVLIGLALPVQAAAADETSVVQVITINTNGNTAAWLEAYKPLSAHLNALNIKATAHVYESQFAGTGAGTIDIVIKYPSMAHMEGNGDRVASDEELAKLFAERDKISATVKSVNLITDVTP